jgi:hypothetical protein
VTSCAIRTVHMEMRHTGFLVVPQNQGQQFVSGLAPNHCDSLLLVWPQNHWDCFSRFVLKIGGDGFSRFGIKTSGFRFPGLGLKTDSSGLVI